MSKFIRGTLVRHKIMGKGIVIDEVSNAMVKVRMANGIVETFYLEELEAEDEVQERERRKTEEVVKSNEERGKRLSQL